MIEELSSSSLLEPVVKKAKQDEDSASPISEEEETNEALMEEAIQDPDGPMCCVCQRFLIHFSLIFLSYVDSNNLHRSLSSNLHVEYSHQQKSAYLRSLGP